MLSTCCAVGRYHEGVAAGDVSQTGQLLTLLLDSVVKEGGYVEKAYTTQLDHLLHTLDGTPYSGVTSKLHLTSQWIQGCA